MNYNYGSYWRKWDFHVHTIESKLNNGFGDDWDNYDAKKWIASDKVSAFLEKQRKELKNLRKFETERVLKLKKEQKRKRQKDLRILKELNKEVQNNKDFLNYYKDGWHDALFHFEKNIREVL